jgi:hypothetical protein
VAWGEAVDGLQAGIAFRPGEKPAHRLGETAHLLVRLRNVSAKDVEVEYRDGFFAENPPTVCFDAPTATRGSEWSTMAGA